MQKVHEYKQKVENRHKRRCVRPPSIDQDITAIPVGPNFI